MTQGRHGVGPWGRHRVELWNLNPRTNGDGSRDGADVSGGRGFKSLRGIVPKPRPPLRSRNVKISKIRCKPSDVSPTRVRTGPFRFIGGHEHPRIVVGSAVAVPYLGGGSLRSSGRRSARRLGPVPRRRRGCLVRPPGPPWAAVPVRQDVPKSATYGRVRPFWRGPRRKIAILRVCRADFWGFKRVFSLSNAGDLRQKTPFYARVGPKSVFYPQNYILCE